MFGSTSALQRSLLFLRLLFGLLLVELKFFSFQDVSIKTSALSWARRDAGHQMTRVELLSKFGINFAVLLSSSNLRLDVTGSLLISASLIRFFKFLFVELHIVFLEIPLSERGSIDEDNGVFHKGLGTDKLVVGRVVDGVHDTSFA